MTAHGSRRRGSRRLSALAAPLLLAVLLTACTEEPADEDTVVTMPGEGNGTTGTGDFDSVVEEYAGQPWFAGTVPDEPVAVTGEPIKLGHINQEDVPIGSYPEVRLGAETAVDFINAELGGIGGRPIELVSCIANFSVEGSQRCAQQMVQEGVIAVAGGIDIMSSGSIPVLEQNNIPYVGGIPINFDEMRSPISFQFSGGAPGAMTAFASDVIDRGLERVAVVYVEFEPVTASAMDYGVRLLEEAGVPTVAAIPYSLTATDMLPVMTQAADIDPQAVLMFAADAACARSMETFADLELEADLYGVGSCAAPSILEEVGDAADGTIFNIEGPFEMDTGVIDTELYGSAVERYGAEGFLAQSAGTVTFRSLMNMWAALNEIGSDDPQPEDLIDFLRSAVDQPSFDGHPYTCDGEQIPDLPSLCAPQQVLVQLKGDGLELHSDGWIDVPAILREYG